MRRSIPLVLVGGLLAGCSTAGWESKVYLRPGKRVPGGEVVAVVTKMKGVSVVSPPPKQPPQDSALEGIQVKRGDVVAIVMFPTPIGLKQKVFSIIVGTQSQSADGKAFVQDLANTLQKKYGDSAHPPGSVKAVRRGGS